MKSPNLAALTAAAVLAFAAIGSSADRAEAWEGGAGAGPAAADVYRYASPRRYYDDGRYRPYYYGPTRIYVDGLGYNRPPPYRRHPYCRHFEHRYYR
jgi:hypothetical protein